MSAKKQNTARTFLFSSESVNEGHPDKLCDQTSDAVLDACLASDPKCKVACESASKDNMVMVFGEITTSAKLDYDAIVRKAVKGIGYTSYEDALDSVNSKGFSDKTCEVLVRINKQSPDIAGGVHVGKDEMDVGAGDQGIMFGYASDETEVCMPLTILIATRLGKKLTDVRKDGSLWWLWPDGKTQVTIEYKQNDDGLMEPLKIHTVVISTQHAEPGKALRSKEYGGYKGPEMTAPTREMLALPAARSSSTHMVVGVRMVEEPFPAKILLRSTDQQRTSAGRWPSQWLRAVSANVPWSSFRTPLVLPSPCLCLLRPMALSSMD